MKKILPLVLMFLAIAVSCVNETDVYPDYVLNTGRINDSLTVNINYGKGIKINGSISIDFIDVENDSRCPSDVICFWAGNAEVKLQLSNETSSVTQRINSNIEPSYIKYGGYLIQLKSLAPYPNSATQIKKEDYIVELIVKSVEAPLPLKRVQIISPENQSLIKNDPLNINYVTILNDNITFNVSYSGGCRTHGIDLFAYNYINKSNPPGVLLNLSHDAQNDGCEAYITENITFNLTALKNHLQRSYNITDKIWLNILDPSGKPYKEGNIEYRF